MRAAYSGPNHLPKAPLWNTVTLRFVVSVVQSLSHVQLFVTPWTAAFQALLSSTISKSLYKFMSIELMMLSNHLIFHRPLFLLPSIFPSISLFQWVISSQQVAKVLELQPLWEIVKYNFTIWPNNLTERYFLKRNENILLYKDLRVSECKSHSRVWLFATLGLELTSLLCPWNSPDKRGL